MLRNTMKRGELAFSQIVIAVIAIFVLIVLMVIFGGNLGGVNNELGTCIAKGGNCEYKADCNEMGGIQRPGTFKECTNDGAKICCMTTATTTLKLNI